MSSSSSSTSDRQSTKVEWGFLKKLFFSNLGMRFVTIPAVIAGLIYIGELPLWKTVEDDLSVRDFHPIIGLELHNDDAIYKEIDEHIVISLRSTAPFEVIVDRQESPVSAKQKFDRKYYVEYLEVGEAEGIRLAKATKPVTVMEVRGKGTLTAESSYGLAVGTSFVYFLFFIAVCVLSFFTFLFYGVNE